MDDLTPEQRHEAYGSSKPPLGNELMTVYLQCERPKYLAPSDVTVILREKNLGYLLSVYAGDVTGRPDLTKAHLSG